MAKMKKKFYQNKKFAIICGAVMAVAVIIVIALNPIDFRAIDDANRAKEFTLSPEMSKLINEIRFTEKGKNILLASSPQLKDKTAFNGTCGHDGDPDVYIAGCYYKILDDEYIDIYNAGSGANSLQTAMYNYDYAKKVTLAHEMLHAAYDRISDNDKIGIEKLLDGIYANNKEIRDELSRYPHDEKYDELYVRAATEIYSLPSELEKHYTRYFQDRMSIAKMYHSNKNDIDEMLAKAKQLETKLIAARSNVFEYNRLVDVYNSYVDIFADTLGKLDSEKYTY